MEDPNTLTGNNTKVDDDFYCDLCEKEFNTEIDYLRHKDKCLTTHNFDSIKVLISKLTTEYDEKSELDKKFDKLNMDYKELLQKYKKQELKLLSYKIFLLEHKRVLNDNSVVIPKELLE
jgi:hypothetical protein